MNLIYILVILVVVTAEVPKIYSEFVTEDSCDEESDYYENRLRDSQSKNYYSGLKIP